MKAIFRNKRLTGAIAIMVGVTILLAGFAFAWFTSGGVANAGTVTLARVSVTGWVEDLDLDPGVVLTPGQSSGEFEDLLGWIQSDSTIPVLVRLNLNYQWTNQYGVVVTEPLGIAIREDGAAGRAWPLGAWYDLNTEAVYLWFFDDEDNIYVWMWGNDRLHFVWDLFSWSLPNDLQESVVDIDFGWLAVQQAPDEAINDILGIDLADLDIFPGLVDIDVDGWIVPGVRPFFVDPRLAELVESMPEGFFKDAFAAAVAG